MLGSFDESLHGSEGVPVATSDSAYVRPSEFAFNQKLGLFLGRPSAPFPGCYGIPVDPVEFAEIAV